MLKQAYQPTQVFKRVAAINKVLSTGDKQFVRLVAGLNSLSHSTVVRWTRKKGWVGESEKATEVVFNVIHLLSRAKLIAWEKTA